MVYSAPGDRLRVNVADLVAELQAIKMAQMIQRRRIVSNEFPLCDS
ncbi:MAG: hypothetical protein O2805_10375 [Proteobacteria bacterium]|nr:hypothetical protein [Pseudomonadota bacterium]